MNADVLAAELNVPPYEAARLADALRRELVKLGRVSSSRPSSPTRSATRSRSCEEAARNGYTVVVCHIGLAGPEQSVERVAMRVSQGGHDVPDDKLRARFSRAGQPQGGRRAPAPRPGF